MVGVYYSVYVKSEVVCLLIRYFKPLQLIFVRGIALPYPFSCLLCPFLHSSSSFPFLNPITPFPPCIFPLLQFCSLLPPGTLSSLVFHHCLRWSCPHLWGSHSMVLPWEIFPSPLLLASCTSGPDTLARCVQFLCDPISSTRLGMTS